MTMRSRLLNSFAQLSSSEIILTLACILAIIVAVILIALERFSLLALLLFLPIALLIVIRPKIGVALFYVSIFIPIGYIQRYYTSLPTIILWLPHLFLLFAVVAVAGNNRSGFRLCAVF
jgi:hypothetical protein